MSAQKIVITGVNGFVGKHLVNELSGSGFAVVGVDRADGPDQSIASILDSFISADLAEGWPEINDVTSVIHLAGLAAVGPSFDDPQSYLTINSSILTHMAEFYLKSETKPRIIVVSSGAIYDSTSPMPLTEESPVGHNSPYALSKILNELQCDYYRSRGLDCVIARPFNHIGPGQKAGFLVPDLYEQLLKAKSTGEDLKVGNLQTQRDYTDVRDVVRAYRLLATTEKLDHSLYNICSSTSVAGEEILKLLQKTTATKDVAVVADPSKIRPNDAQNIVGDNSLIKNDTGWQPEIALEQTIADFVEDSKLQA